MTRPEKAPRYYVILTRTKEIYSFMQSKLKNDLGEFFIIINATLAEAVGDLNNSDVWKSIILSDSTLVITALLQVTLYMTSFESQRLEVNATRTTSIPPEPSIV
jgi:hypothetical protein